MNKTDIALLWAVACFSGLASLGARLSYLLFGIAELPPEDPVQFVAWKRKRWWLIFSECAALPSFATGWTAAAVYWSLPVPFVVLGSMASGALGFGFLLDALQTIVRKRVGNA